MENHHVSWENSRTFDWAMASIANCKRHNQGVSFSLNDATPPQEGKEGCPPPCDKAHIPGSRHPPIVSGTEAPRDDHMKIQDGSRWDDPKININFMGCETH